MKECNSCFETVVLRQSIVVAGQSPTTASTLKTAMIELLFLDMLSFAMRPIGAAAKSSNPAKHYIHVQRRLPVKCVEMSSLFSLKQ